MGLGREDVGPRRCDLQCRGAAVHLGARLARVDGPPRHEAVSLELGPNEMAEIIGSVRAGMQHLNRGDS